MMNATMTILILMIVMLIMMMMAMTMMSGERRTTIGSEGQSGGVVVRMDVRTNEW